MYTIDTNSFYNFSEARDHFTPNWFSSEKYYNCEYFFSTLQKKVKKEKKHRKNH